MRLLKEKYDYISYKIYVINNLVDYIRSNIALSYTTKTKIKQQYFKDWNETFRMWDNDLRNTSDEISVLYNDDFRFNLSGYTTYIRCLNYFNYDKNTDFDGISLSVYKRDKSLSFRINKFNDKVYKIAELIVGINDKCDFNFNGYGFYTAKFKDKKWHYMNNEFDTLQDIHDWLLYG